jgi:ankyrin repeat protein
MKKTFFKPRDVNLKTIDGVKKFLEEYDIEAKDGRGMTPLVWALLNRRLEVVKYLREHGADVNPKDKNGRTLLSILPAMIYLAEHGCEELLYLRNLKYSTILNILGMPSRRNKYYNIIRKLFGLFV